MRNGFVMVFVGFVMVWISFVMVLVGFVMVLVGSKENNEESEMKFGEGSRDDYGGDVDDDDAGAEIMKRKKNEEVEYEEEAGLC